MLRVFSRGESILDLISGFLEGFGERVDRRLRSQAVNASIRDKDRIRFGGECKVGYFDRFVHVPRIAVPVDRLERVPQLGETCPG